MALQTCCLIGRGKVSMREVEDPQENPFEFVGNVEQFNLSVEENEVSVQDFTSPGGGKDCSYTSIDAVNFNMIMRCYKSSNLAKAIYGNVVPVAGSTVAGEEHEVLGLDSFIPFDKLADMSGTVTVTDDTDPTPVALVKGVDYELGNNGIYILPTATLVDVGDTIIVGYTSPAYDEIQMITKTGATYEIILDGVNGEDGKPFFVHLYNVKLAPATQLDFISEEFAQIEITGEVLKADGIVASDTTSAYGKMRI